MNPIPILAWAVFIVVIILAVIITTYYLIVESRDVPRGNKTDDRKNNFPYNE